VRLKLDENIGRRGLELLRAAGHDLMTVRDQSLQGAKDETLFQVCTAEGRVRVTLDRDFGQVLRFPPEKSAGVVILDTGPRTTQQGLLDRMRDFLATLAAHPLTGKLWIVEAGRVRMHLRDKEN
jgi:predicted nuclease of predicted toxin-antitoxin system